MKDFDFDTPDPEAYGRVTNPERFAVVVNEAYTLIDELEPASGFVLENGVTRRCPAQRVV